MPAPEVEAGGEKLIGTPGTVSLGGIPASDLAVLREEVVLEGRMTGHEGYRSR